MEYKIKKIEAVTEEMLQEELASLEAENAKLQGRFAAIAHEIDLTEEEIEQYKQTRTEVRPSYYRLGVPWMDCANLQSQLSNARERAANPQRWTRKPGYVLCVYGAYEIKDALKAQGFCFDCSDKAWIKKFDTETEAIAAQNGIGK